jgi:pimeloyl-ACP methyl ester carboxylesterase
MAELPGLRLIAPDRPGCGLADGFNYRGVDLRAHAVAYLEQLLNELGLERVALLGNSMGGLWAFWLALDRPERVSGIIQVGYPALILGTGAPLGLRLLSIPGLNRLLIRIAQPGSESGFVKSMTVLGEQQALPVMHPEFKRLMMANALLPGYEQGWLTLVENVCHLWGSGSRWRYSLSETDLQHISQPTLFVWGNLDTHGSLDVARRAAAAFQESRLVELEPAGHLPWLDDPRGCASPILEFMGGHNRDKGTIADISANRPV